MPGVVRTGPRSWYRHAVSALLITTCACSVFAPGSKDHLPADHDTDQGGAMHKTGHESPYLEPGSCFTFTCHHADLRGGSAEYEHPDTGERVRSLSPSCYQCHGTKWETDHRASILMTHPTTGVVWRHGERRAVEWWGPRSDSTAVFLYDGDTLVATLQSMSPVEAVARFGTVQPSWGTGDTYRIRITQSDGADRFGAPFTICGEGEEIPVTTPAVDDGVAHGETLTVEWRCATGFAVDIFVRAPGGTRHDFRLAAINGDTAERIVPEEWGTGSGYTIEVVDEDGRIGISNPFEIHPAP